MLDSLKPGAKIVTVGGVMGTIVSLHDDYLVIRVADKVEIRVTRAAVAQVLSKGSEGKKAAKKAEKPEVVEEKNDVKAEAAQQADENQKDAQ